MADKKKGQSQAASAKDDKDKDQEERSEKGASDRAQGERAGEERKDRFQSLPLREYYDHSVTAVLLEGLRELGKQRPDNPIQFLGRFLLDNDPERKR